MEIRSALRSSVSWFACPVLRLFGFALAWAFAVRSGFPVPSVLEFDRASVCSFSVLVVLCVVRIFYFYIDKNSSVDVEF